MRAAVALSACLSAVPVGAAETGLASHYHEPQRVACGGWLNPAALEAAHRTLPCGTMVTVRAGDRSVQVRITDRGPFVRGRIIDLTPAAFLVLAPLGQGVVRVTVE